jgi:hypothetical protein
MRGAIPPLPEYVFMAWCIVKHRDNFTFYLYLLEGEENHETDRVSVTRVLKLSSRYSESVSLNWLWATSLQLFPFHHR